MADCSRPPSRWATTTTLATLLTLGIGCKDADEQSPKQDGGKPTPVADTSPPSWQRRDITSWAGGASRVAIGDLDGDGKTEIVLGEDERLRVVTADGRPIAEAPALGGIHVLETGDLDGDGRDEILAGWGRSREQRDAPVRVIIYRLAGKALVADQVLEEPTERAEVVAVIPAPPELIIAWYQSKYMVTSARAAREGEGWRRTPLASIRMATSLARGDVDGDGQPDLVVGRVYGDSDGAPGDAFVLAPDGSRRPIPVVGGVRGLAVAPDGAIWLGDGWDRNYGRKARARLSVAHSFQTQLVDDVVGEFMIDDIVIGDLDADGVVEIVTRGNKTVRIYERAESTWNGSPVAGVARDLALGELNGRPGSELVIVGDRSEIISRR